MDDFSVERALNKMLKEYDLDIKRDENGRITVTATRDGAFVNSYSGVTLFCVVLFLGDRLFPYQDDSVPF